ncbi:hypothetical protein AQI95_12175 [Streptomyces yokosukanensis]|uniref:Uncharacterized protein n=1 Tax=Streptomyces yokosukanensis TaxID=67386 RepID=A0A101P832_9ACTN|nr:hypothetical protein AQI95_12175 [Streptomyces yokosukanensis]
MCGTLAAGLLALGVHLGLSAVGRLALTGHPLSMRVTVCDTNGPATNSRYGPTDPGLWCKGYADGHPIRATGFTSSPFPGAPVEVAREPWGSWVPVDQGAWNKAGRALSPLIPLAFAGVFAWWTLINCRDWRNSRRSPTGS